MIHLQWQKTQTPSVHVVNDLTLEYNNKVYTKISVIKKTLKNKVTFVLDNEEITLSRNNNPYLYEDGCKNEYLVFADGIFSFKEQYNGSLFTPALFLGNNSFDINTNKGNLLIEGDNLQGLKLIAESHKESVDLITIDPPYNTRNKTMRYNDYFPILKGGDEHSSWLSFMHERLIIAKELLTEDGLILINIDEFEYPYLKLLCDQIFGFSNAVETFIWEKNSTKNNSKTTSTNHEYILCYAKNIENIEGKGYFRQEKPGIRAIKELKQLILNDDSIIDKQSALEKALVKFYKDNPELKGIKQYKKVDNNLNIFRISDVSAPSGGGLKYDILHPVTGKPCKQPAGGFRYKESTLKEHLKNDLFYFGKDEQTVPQFKRYLDDMETEIVKSVIRNTSEGKKDLEDLFGFSHFNNPKPISLISTFIGFIPKKSITCLDFFAGSGTAGHAVMDYNKEHGTDHNFILMTNNENNICQDVTKPRLEKAIEKYNFDEQFSHVIIKTK